MIKSQTVEEYEQRLGMPLHEHKVYRIWCRIAGVPEDNEESKKLFIFDLRNYRKRDISKSDEMQQCIDVLED